MALYKENKVNPASGCLPLLIQLPVLILLFNVLRESASKFGTDTFFRMLRDWYSENKFKVVHGADFVNHVLKYDSSDEVIKILNRYLHEDYL